MAHFLRDQQLTNHTIRSENIAQIGNVFAERLQVFNASLPANSPQDARAFLMYVVRFDGKGYRVFSIAEVQQYFQQARVVERVVFTLLTPEAFRTNGNFGTHVELRFDANDVNGSYLKITADDRDWVDASFSAIQDWLAKCHNRHGLVRTSWTPFLVQIFGVALMFFVSLLVAAKASPKLNIENAFLVSFLFVFLLLSNTWTFVNAQIGRLINYAFPNVRFSRPSKDRLHWFLQTLVGAAFIGATVYLLGLAGTYITESASTLVKRD